MGALTNEKGQKKLTGGVKKGQNMKTPRLTGRRVSRLVGGLGKLVPKHLRVSVADSRFLKIGFTQSPLCHPGPRAGISPIGASAVGEIPDQVRDDKKKGREVGTSPMCGMNQR